MVAVAISRFALSCSERWVWSLECWLFGFANVLDWVAFVALAVLALYACYRVLEHIEDLRYRVVLKRVRRSEPPQHGTLTEQELKGIVRPFYTRDDLSSNQQGPWRLK